MLPIVVGDAYCRIVYFKIDNTTIRITNNNGKHIKRNRIRKKAENGYGVSSVDVAVVYY